MNNQYASSLCLRSHKSLKLSTNLNASNKLEYVDICINKTSNWFSNNFMEINSKEHIKVGKGIYYFNDVSKYIGEWMNNLHNDQGLLTWPNGSRHELNLERIKLKNMKHL